MERRNHPRVAVTHPALYSSNVYPRPKVASTLDLSLGGTKIEIIHTLDKNEGLEISIAIQPQVIKCRGKVIYVQERENGKVEAGIQFEGLSAPDQLYLRQYLLHVMDQQALKASLSVD
ncbi:MAG: hypothetical protein GTN81_06405 [Proteobacteria bacterium]|nr:hypothetical protein [Pseudomonadota bacterium]